MARSLRCARVEKRKLVFRHASTTSIPRAGEICVAKAERARKQAHRGWCRFELLIAELAATAPRKLLVHSATAVSVPEQGDYFIDDAQCDRSVSKFRRAMSMRSSESPLAGGDE